jgi:hypothetical protein
MGQGAKRSSSWEAEKKESSRLKAQRMEAGRIDD